MLFDIMEGLNKENKIEKEKAVSVVLDEEKVGAEFWGRNVDVAADELIKIFSIIKHITEKGFTINREVEVVASDLLKEFNVKVLNYKTVFTNKVIDQILHAKEIYSVSLEFNGKPLIAKRGSTVESVVEAWEKLGFYSQKAIKTREIEQESENKAVKQEQAILDRMLSELDALDFANQEKLVDWLYEYYSHYIRGADMHKSELLEKFKVNGYGPEDNDAMNAMLGKTLKDKDRLGRVIIGHLLMNGSLALRNTGLKNSISDWKKA